jgi:hypothetical protein
MRRLLIAILALGGVGFMTSIKASPTTIEPDYYRKFSCQQLLAEARSVSARAIVLTNDAKRVQTKNDMASTEDVVAVPKFVSDTKPVSGELALIKGRLLAIEDASIQSQCQIEFLDLEH